MKIRDWELVLSAVCLAYKHEFVLGSQLSCGKLGVAIQICNPQTGEMETEGSLEYTGQLVIHSGGMHERFHLKV